MARIRQIKPDFYLDDDLALCSREARLMFPGLWMLADRAGRLEDRPARIKAQIFPYDQDISPKEVGGFLDELASHSFITRYQAAGKNLIQIRTFEKHQHCHINEPNSQLPPPEGLTEKYGASTVQAPYKHGASTVQAPEEHRTARGTYTYTYTGGFLCVGSTSGVAESGVNLRGGTNPTEKNTPIHTPASTFVLTDELRSWADEAAPDIDPEIEAENFRDYYQARGKTFPDWAAQFRTWIRGALERKQRARARSPTGRREARAEDHARIFREIAENPANATEEKIIREIEAEFGLKRAPPGGRPH